MPIYLCATRFNSETWKSNDDYRKKHKIKGCIYGTPKMLAENIINDSFVIVLEMFNKKLPSKLSERDVIGSGGTIQGIGLIRNTVANIHPKIYEDGNYNRFIYKSKYRIDRNDMDRIEEAVMLFFDVICFKGPDHIKRGKGIILVPPKKIKNCNIHETFVTDYLMNMFIKRFPDINPKS